jgi:hypothetical protein
MSIYKSLTEIANATRIKKNKIVEAAEDWVEDTKENISTFATVAGVLAEGVVSGAINENSTAGAIAANVSDASDSLPATGLGLVGGAAGLIAGPAGAYIGYEIGTAAGSVVGATSEALSNVASEVLKAAGRGGETDTETVFFSQQCFLIYNVEAFSKFHQKLLSKNLDPGMPNPNFYSPMSPTKDIDTGGYYGNGGPQKIYLTSTEDAGFLFNKLGMKKHGDLFANMKTPEIAQLVPRLRIYKVYRENGETTGKKVELEFAAGSDTDFYTTQLDTQPFSGASKEFVRGMDVGVESFSWRFIGDDPFMATRFVEAELKLTGQTMQAFFYQRTSNNVIPRNSDKDQYRYLDLILQPDCRRNRDAALVWETYSPECYEVQVEVGYNGSNKDFGTFDDDETFRQAIDAQTEVLRLGVQEHSFDFKEDGSVGLTIKFKGFLELFAKDKSMNILLPYGGMANNSIRVNLSDVSPAIINKFGSPSLISSFERLNGFATLLDTEDLLVILQNEKETEDIKNAKEKIETQITNILVSSKQALMSHILNRLETSNAVYTYIMSSEEERSFNNPDENNFSPPTKVGLNKVMSGGHGRLDNASSLTGEASGRRISLELAANNQESLNNIIDSGLENSFVDNSLSNFLGRNRLINYFFIGDLIAVILDSIAGDDTFTFSDQNFYFSDLPAGGLIQDTLATGIQLAEAIAPVEGQLGLGIFSGEPSIDTKTVAQVLNQIRVILGNAKFTLKGEGAPTIVNIANIPVTVQSFNQFMIDNVLSKDVDNYPFFEFIDDLIKALVTDFLGSRCFGGLIESSATPQTAVFNSSKELAATAPHQTFYMPQANSAEAEYNVIHPSKISKTNPLFNTTRVSQADKIYFAFNINSIDESKMNGKYADDIETGVFHLAHGINRGLVKSMRFEKVNQEFVAEAVFASEGGTILSQLANKFDVVIDMVGNNLFRIGQYVYINAESFGAGPSYYDDGEGPNRKRSWANIMGLGGYHLITAVDNTISADGTFKTTIKARWETGGTPAPGSI